MNLATLLRQTTTAHPTQPAIKLGPITIDYAGLNDAATRVSGLLLARGVSREDRVGIMLPNIPEFAAIYYGVLNIGAVVVPMNPLLKAREVEYYLTDSGARLLFVAAPFAEEAQRGADRVEGVQVVSVTPGAFLGELAAQPAHTELVERDDQDTAVILYTSGTTGTPKGAELTHGNLRNNVAVVLSDLMPMTTEDVIFAGLPLFHVFGQTAALNCGIAAGATLVMQPRFDAVEVLEKLAAEGVTVFEGVPTMFSGLLQVPSQIELPKLRVCATGGAAMPVEVLGQFERRFGAIVLEGYGLSETSPVASFNLLHARKVGSIGRPVTGVEMRILDQDGQPLPPNEPGEIAVRGHNVMKGYWGKPEATAAVLSGDGWFRTGDIGMTDDEGYFFVVDRLKDLIIRGGYNVYPREIEEVLYEHPEVVEAAVIGIPHADLGEEVAAAVVLKSGSHTTADELRAYVRDQVAAYKYPRVLWTTDQLPKGATGKILKREIVPPAEFVGGGH